MAFRLVQGPLPIRPACVWLWITPSGAASQRPVMVSVCGSQAGEQQIPKAPILSARGPVVY